jgi:biopolymer transport protein ExbD
MKLDRRITSVTVLRAFWAASLLILLNVSCSEDRSTAIEVASDGSLTVDGIPVSLEELVSMQITDPVRVIAEDAATFAHVDALAGALHEAGVHNLSLRGAPRDPPREIPAALVAPEFEMAIFPYNMLHITIAADQTIYVLRGEETEGQVSTINALADLVNRVVDTNPAVTVGLGIEPDVAFRVYWLVLDALYSSSVSRTIVNAPVPGYVPETIAWRKPDAKISILYYEPWADMSRATGAS